MKSAFKIAGYILYGMLVLIFLVVAGIFCLVIMEEHCIETTRKKIKDIVKTTEKLDKFKDPDNRGGEKIEVGTDAWGRPILMRFITDEVFVIESEGPKDNISVDNISIRGRIE